jgi:hypothetical protein
MGARAIRCAQKWNHGSSQAGCPWAAAVTWLWKLLAKPGPYNMEGDKAAKRAAMA